MRAFFLLLLVLPKLALACDPENAEDPTAAETDCVAASSWQMSLALGAGVRTNPLEDGDHIPLVVLPDVAWYGEHAYFDNGELGYQFIEEANWGAEAYVTLDRERANFSFWQPSNVFVPTFGFASDTPSLAPSIESTREPVSIDRIASRDWAINGGARIRWYTGAHQVKLSVETDISNTHEGNKAALSYLYATSWQDWQMTISPSLIWKSDKLINYYYGLSDRDGVSIDQFYLATGGWQPALSLRISKPLTKKWQFLFFSSYQRLHGGMRNSPLVRSGNIRSIFIGAGYTF